METRIDLQKCDEQPSQDDAELLFLRRGIEVMRFKLASRNTILGHANNCDVILADPGVAAQQAMVRFEPPHYVLEDLSGQGTEVQGAVTQKTILKDGDILTFGKLQAVFHIQNAQGAQLYQGPRTLFHPNSKIENVPAQIRVSSSKGEKVFPLKRDISCIGSAEDNDVIIEDKYVSAKHLRLTQRNGVFIVADPHSTNGTWLGNVRIYEAELPIYAQLRLGDTTISIEPVEKESPAVHTKYGIIGADPGMRHLLEMVERVAPSNATVAIFGESGSGKELIARAVHKLSLRSNNTFIPVNCAAISRELIESELFGHEKGSFTGAAAHRKGAFEEAHQGSLFLDEVGELPLDLQAKLLRALESGEIKRVGTSRPISVDVRIISATNRDLGKQVQEGKFREDLYYRLCVIPLHLPPLRARLGDLEMLTEAFLSAFSPSGQRVCLTPPAQQKLLSHPWPGNVRELRNVIHRALLLRDGAVIDVKDILFDGPTTLPPHPQGLPLSNTELPAGLTLDKAIENFEKNVIETALKRHKNNRERVAKELGVARSTLFKRLKEWGLTQSGDED
ncbi:MAG: sigma 54-interacting transcriptional regulator [Cystobacterineae bacterium]|nr:sigma 54-interacting transcriptional regulator [Cystobacterineae bacterium]